MTNDEIRELLRIFNESGVGELEVQRGRDRLLIRRNSNALPAAPPPVPPPIPPIHQALVQHAGPAVEAAPAEPVPAPANPGATEALVKSPIVGTFYDAPSPGAPPFVRVGDKVEVGQVLCIIESMKLMNEIEAEVAGTVAAKLVENGSPVEYGQPLISIQPR